MSSSRLVFACSGGGCSGCEGCGIYPIPGGFPIAERIPNSAQVRLSESGIGFIEDNIDGIARTLLPDGLDFEVPEVSGSQTILFVTMRYTVCPSSRPPCFIHAEIADLEVDDDLGRGRHCRIRTRVSSARTSDYEVR